MPERRPKVLFIRPRLPSNYSGLDYAERLSTFKYITPPLGLMTLAAVIGDECDVEIRDENISMVEHDTDADIVAITGFILDAYHVGRMKALSKYFRERGKLICMGGSVANLLPEIIRDDCDVMFTGEGELTWKQFIADFKAANYQASYEQVDLVDMAASPPPRLDLINPNDYFVGTIQTTRGCPFTCEFCDIIVMYGRKVRTKSIATVMQEVKAWADAGQQGISFVDDNFVGNRPYVKELLRELIKFNAKRKYPIQFLGQASIDMARDPELLMLLREANFTFCFIGVESPRKDSLAETLKVQNVHTQNLEEAIHTIQSYGIWVTGGMIVGFDHDDIDIFDEQYEFVQKAGIIFPMMNVLAAPPKTPLYERMKAAGRLYPMGEPRITNFSPLGMTYEQLVENYTKLCIRVYSHDAVLERFLRSLEYMKDCMWEKDRTPFKLSTCLALLKLVGHYMFTRDTERRRFFLDMVRGTYKLNPRAMKYTARFLLQQIHISQHFRKKVELMQAANPQEALDHIHEQRVREVIAGSSIQT